MEATITLQGLAPRAAPRSQRQTAPEQPRDGGKPAPASGVDLPPQPKIESIESAVQQINAYLASSQRQLSFQVHEASGRTILRVMNPETGEMVRQVPSEEVLKLAAALHSQGLHIFNELA